jgi:hypothetical protein
VRDRQGSACKRRGATSVFEDACNCYHHLCRRAPARHHTATNACSPGIMRRPACVHSRAQHAVCARQRPGACRLPVSHSSGGRRSLAHMQCSPPAAAAATAGPPVAAATDSNSAAAPSTAATAATATAAGAAAAPSPLPRPVAADQLPVVLCRTSTLPPQVWCEVSTGGTCLLCMWAVTHFDPHPAACKLSKGAQPPAPA